MRVIENSVLEPSGRHIPGKVCHRRKIEAPDTMNQDDNRPEKNAAQQRREQRLSEQLRANLQRRKLQTRARRTGSPDERPEGLDPAKSAPDQ